MKSKKTATDKAASQLTSLVQRHLVGLPKSQREKNIRALEKVAPWQKEKPIKVRCVVELKVTDASKLLKWAKKKPIFDPPDPDVLWAIHEAVDRMEVPGLEFVGCSTEEVEWFEHDHLLDESHPDYRETVPA